MPSKLWQNVCLQFNKVMWHRYQKGGQMEDAVQLPVTQTK